METMRQLLDQMDVLVVQAQQQQGQDTQTSTKDPEDQAFETFVAATIREFLIYWRQKQKAKQRREMKQQQQQQTPQRPPGFHPNPNLC